MLRILFVCIVLSFVCACTTVRVQPINSDLHPAQICIEENPMVIVGDFLSVVRNRIEHHGIDTMVFTRTAPSECEYILTYTAFKTWDIGTYMHHAELRLSRNGRRVGYAEYHLNGQGGLSLMKWQGTKTKMDPVVDELLGMTGEERIDSSMKRPRKEERKEGASSVDSETGIGGDSSEMDFTESDVSPKKPMRKSMKELLHSPLPQSL